MNPGWRKISTLFHLSSILFQIVKQARCENMAVLFVVVEVQDMASGGVENIVFHNKKQRGAIPWAAEKRWMR